MNEGRPGGRSRRVEVEANDHGALVLEHRDVRDLQPLQDIWLEADIPTASANVARLQGGAFGGTSCAVFAITADRTCLGSGGKRKGRVLVALEPRYAIIDKPLQPAAA